VIFGCRTSQQRVGAAFADAVALSWPKALFDVLTAQHAAMARARDVFVAMQY
jgi:hypothetical protein